MELQSAKVWCISTGIAADCMSHRLELPQPNWHMYLYDAAFIVNIQQKILKNNNLFVVKLLTFATRSFLFAILRTQIHFLPPTWVRLPEATIKINYVIDLLNV